MGQAGRVVTGGVNVLFAEGDVAEKNELGVRHRRTTMKKRPGIYVERSTEASNSS